MVIPSIIGLPNIVIHVRHSASCPHKGKGEFYKSCKCKKHLRWHHRNKLYRVSAKTRTWEGAERARRVMEAQLEAQLFGHVPAAPGATTAKAPEASVPRDLAVWMELFLETLTGDSQGVQDTYRRQLKGSDKDGKPLPTKSGNEGRSLLSFLDTQAGGKSFPADVLQPNILVKFKATLADLDPATQSKFQQRIKKFLKYLNGNGALAYVPLLDPIKQDPNKESKLPLEDEQYEQLLAAIPTVSNGRAQSVRALALLMRHTALAIHDASNLQRSAFSQDAEGWIMATSRQKTGKPVSVPVPRTIAEELLSLPDVNGGFFFERRGADAHGTADAWGNDLGKVFKKVGLDWPKYGTHSLRHTFACVKLIDGFSYEQVGVWMGDTAEMIERTYSRMIGKRWKDSHAKARGGADFIAHD